MSDTRTTTLGKPRQLEILDIMQNFNFHKKVSSRVLQSYCDRKGYEFLGAGDYEDHVYQYEHDQRAKAIIPLVLAELQKFQYVEDYIGESKKEKVKEENGQIEFAIAKICEDHGLQYREIDVLIKNFGEEMNAITNNASTRMNNMCAIVISDVAQQKFGEVLTVKDLGDYHRKASGYKGEDEVE
jgi:hypothetical protein